MQRVNPFLELFKLFSQAPDCRGALNKLLPGRERRMKWMVCCSQQHFSRGVCAAAPAPGRRSCHISVDFSQAESSVLTSYFLGVRWKFLKNKSRRQAPTFLPIIHNLWEVRQERTTECFQFASEQKEKENWNSLVKPDTPHFFKSGPKWRWHLKRMPAFPGICLKIRCCGTAITDAENNLVRNTGFKENPPLWGHEVSKLGTF